MKTADAFFNGETFSDQIIQTNYDNRRTVSEFLWSAIFMVLAVIGIAAVLLGDKH